MSDEIVRRVAEVISDELKLHKQSLDWEDADGPIQRAARSAIEAMRMYSAATQQDGEWVSCCYGADFMAFKPNKPKPLSASD